MLLLLLLLMLFRKIAPSAIYRVLRTRRSTLTRTCCARLLEVHRGNGARHFALPCIGKINAHHFSRFVEWGGKAGLRNRSDSTSSHQMCPIAMWHSWMRAVFAVGTVTETLDARARRPPSLPERPMVL